MEFLCTADKDVKMVQPHWKTGWQFLKRFNIDMSYEATIPLLNIHPRFVKVYIHRETWTRKFIAPLFVILKKTKKQCKHSSAVEWIYKLLYIYTMEYCLVVNENNELLICTQNRLIAK